jgi:RNA polymerase sigma factor (sigma-70 family)
VRLDSPGAGSTSGAALKVELSADLPTPSANARMDEEARLIEEAMASRLKTDEREIIRLAFFEGLSLLQIGGRLGLTYDQVRERYRAAMRRLERALEALR